MPLCLFYNKATEGSYMNTEMTQFKNLIDWTDCTSKNRHPNPLKIHFRKQKRGILSSHKIP